MVHPTAMVQPTAMLATVTAAIPAARISRTNHENAHLIDSKSVRGDIRPVV
jgi:hypothetical protein